MRPKFYIFVPDHYIPLSMGPNTIEQMRSYLARHYDILTFPREAIHLARPLENVTFFVFALPTDSLRYLKGLLEENPALIIIADEYNNKIEQLIKEGFRVMCPRYVVRLFNYRAASASDSSYGDEAATADGSFSPRA